MYDGRQGLTRFYTPVGQYSLPSIWCFLSVGKPIVESQGSVGRRLQVESPLPAFLARGRACERMDQDWSEEACDIRLAVRSCEANQRGNRVASDPQAVGNDNGPAAYKFSGRCASSVGSTTGSSVGKAAPGPVPGAVASLAGRAVRNSVGRRVLRATLSPVDNSGRRTATGSSGNAVRS